MATVNPWRRFLNLLPGGQRAVGTVASIDSISGTSIVTLRNGSQIAAVGTSVAVGQQCFMVDGQITGPAPQLPQYDIEV